MTTHKKALIRLVDKNGKKIDGNKFSSAFGFKIYVSNKLLATYEFIAKAKVAEKKDAVEHFTKLELKKLNSSVQNKVKKQSSKKELKKPVASKSKSSSSSKPSSSKSSKSKLTKKEIADEVSKLDVKLSIPNRTFKQLDKIASGLDSASYYVLISNDGSILGGEQFKNAKFFAVINNKQIAKIESFSRVKSTRSQKLENIRISMSEFSEKVTTSEQLEKSLSSDFKVQTTVGHYYSLKYKKPVITLKRNYIYNRAIIIPTDSSDDFNKFVNKILLDLESALVEANKDVKSYQIGFCHLRLFRPSFSGNDLVKFAHYQKEKFDENDNRSLVEGVDRVLHLYSVGYSIGMARISSRQGAKIYAYDTLLGESGLLRKVDYYLSEDKADSMGISGFQIEIYVSDIDNVPPTIMKRVGKKKLSEIKGFYDNY